MSLSMSLAVSVIDVIHRDRDGGGVGCQLSVECSELERIRSEVVQRRRVGNVRRHAAENAMRRRASDRMRERIAVDIGRGECDRQRDVFIRGDALTLRGRRRIDLRQRHIDTVAPSVVDLE